MSSGTSVSAVAALAIAALFAATTIGHGVFVPAVTDASGYVSSGERLHRGELFVPAPLQLWAPWARGGDIGLPLAYRPGPASGTGVSTYPPGLPLLMAAADAVAGPLGAYLVAPVMGGVLVMAVFAVARRMGGDGAALVAPLLAATSPIVVLHGVHPMSDVPATACWMVAWWLTLQGTASASVTAGLVTAVAVLIRPNLAPLAGVLVVVLLVARRNARPATARLAWTHAAGFMAAAAAGPALLWLSQAVLYGSPFESSYGNWRALFSTAYILPNVKIYARLVTETHTVLPFAGLLAAPLALCGGDSATARETRVIVFSAAALIGVNLALYLPYMPFDHWPFVRFLLPALAASFVMLARVAALFLPTPGAAWRPRWRAGLALVPCLAIVATIVQGLPYTRYALGDWREHARIRLMGRYLAEVLPARAAVLSFTHSGAVAYYTGRQVVRLDLMDPRSLDGIVADLRLHGYVPVFVLDETIEEAEFRRRFAMSRFGTLAWPPRAVFGDGVRIHYFDAADLDRASRGERWPVDVVR